MAPQFAYMCTNRSARSPTWRIRTTSARLSIRPPLGYYRSRKAAQRPGLRIAGPIFWGCEPRGLHSSVSWEVGVYTLLAPIRHVLHAINQKKCTISIFPRMAFAEFFGNLQHLKNFWVRASSSRVGQLTIHTSNLPQGCDLLYLRGPKGIIKTLWAIKR